MLYRFADQSQRRFNYKIELSSSCWALSITRFYIHPLVAKIQRKKASQLAYFPKFLIHVFFFVFVVFFLNVILVVIIIGIFDLILGSRYLFLFVYIVVNLLVIALRISQLAYRRFGRVGERKWERGGEGKDVIATPIIVLRRPSDWQVVPMGVFSCCMPYDK